ncbi:MAG: SusC/RagA family TonB-linked outer membrane protein, partial [Paludibacteraceae bacterium]
VGQKANATVKISGGNEKISYYTSYGYLKDEGYYISSDYDRFTVRGNLDYKPKKWLKGGLNIAYTYSNQNNPGQGDNMNNGFAYVNGIPPIYPVFLYNEDGTIATDPKTGDYAYDYGMNEGYGRGFGSGINPAGALRYDKQNTKQHQVSAVGDLEFTLYKGLKLELTAGLQYIGANVSELTNKYYGDAAGLGRISKTQYNILLFEAKELLKYNKDFGDHVIDVMAGHETVMYSESGMYGGMSKIADPNSLELSNAIQMSSVGSYTRSSALESYLAQASYWYKDRYGLTANYRADGSSNFAKGHRWGHFGSVGVAWKFTEEDFMASVTEYLNNGKLRFSWGMLGNQEVGSDRYHDMWSIEYVDGQVGYVWSSPGTENITWETSSQYDLGLEFSIMKYLDIELDYFYKTTFDCLMRRFNAPSMGYSYTWINGGKISNQGFEFQLNAHAVDTRNVKLDIRWNGGFYRNKVLELPKYIGEEEDMTTNGGYAVGHSMYEYHLTEYMGVDPETGEALYKAYYDAAKGSFGTNNAMYITEEDVAKGNGNNYITNVYDYKMKNENADVRDTITTRYEYCGYDFNGKSAEADLEGGFGIDLEVFGVSLSVTCGYRIGGYGVDYTYMQLMGNEKVGNYNWHVDMRNAWTETNTNTDIPRLSNNADLYTNSSSTRFLTSNSYLSLNNIRLGYTFPKKLMDKAKIKKLEIYVQGDNLAIATARKGYNPIVSLTGASDSYQYTPLSTIMGGIKIIF